VTLLSLLFLSGCEEYPVYSNFIEKQNQPKPTCIKIASFDPKLTTTLNQEFSSIIEINCTYSIVGYIHHVDSCSNPQVKSLGADFNGYVRLKLLEGNQTLYRIQSDFKDNELSALKRVIETMKKELF